MKTQAEKVIDWLIFSKPDEPMPPLIEDLTEVPYPKGFEPTE